MGQKQTPKTRRDGWTAERQLRFLDALVQTNNVRGAAAAAGLTRESAYRLRERREGALFAALWDRALKPAAVPREVHTRPLTNHRLMGLLGTHYRRKRGDYSNIRDRGAGPRET